MESEFEPAVHREETPEALILVVDVPGFTRQDLRVQINSRRDLIISGERPVKEMAEQTTKVGGRPEKMRSGGHKFRKLVNVPENVNLDDITAKLKDQMLRVSLPFVQENQKPLIRDHTGHVADLSEQSMPDERSSPVKQQLGLMEDESKAKASAAGEAEAPKHSQDFAHGEPRPRSSKTQAVSAQAGSDRRVLIVASTVLVLCACMYLSYILRSRKAD